MLVLNSPLEHTSYLLEVVVCVKGETTRTIGSTITQVKDNVKRMVMLVLCVVDLVTTDVGGGARRGNHWNVHGWPQDVNSDKFKIRARSIELCDLDICGIAETHSVGDNTPSLDGYTVFSHNRKSIHKKAKCGSGGVCLFVKHSIIVNYNVNILDKSFDDILWVSFEHKVSLQGINVFVCYLSPEGSSHIVDPHEYFDQLLSQIYMFQNNGQYIICGDFNARTRLTILKGLIKL